MIDSDFFLFFNFYVFYIVQSYNNGNFLNQLSSVNLNNSLAN